MSLDVFDTLIKDMIDYLDIKEDDIEKIDTFEEGRSYNKRIFVNKNVQIKYSCFPLDFSIYYKNVLTGYMINRVKNIIELNLYMWWRFEGCGSVN